MAHRLRHLARILSLVVVLTMLLGPAALAQDATPEASPVADGATPEASPVGSPEASPVAATCDPFTSPTAADERAALEAAFPIEQPANTEGSYITGAVGDLQAINPVFIESDPSITIAGYIFEGIVGGNKDGQPVAGGLTDYYEIASDCVTYTFHLKTDKAWHDGPDVTAADVAFSLETLADESLASPYTGTFLDAVASWNVVDDDTIELVATAPRADFLYSINALYILPRHIWEGVPRSEWVTDPGTTGQDPARVVGTGPFRFESWTQGQEIRLVRNDSYSPRRAWIKDVTIRLFTELEAQFNAFLTGEIDDMGTTGVEPEQIAQVEANPETLSIGTYADRGFTYWEFNLDPAITTRFQDARVRQAFMWATDRQSIVDNILLGYGEVANGTQPSISYAYAPEGMDTIYTYDPARATALLTDAGWTDTNGDGTVDKDGVEMAFEFLYPSGLATNDSLVAYLQDAWSQVGISITPRGLEFPALIEATTTTPTFEMALYGFSWDASFIQDAMFGCDQYQVGYNDMRYCNPELDALADEIATTIDVEARTALMIEYSNIVNEEQPIGIINFRVSREAWNNRLHNVFPTAWGGAGIDYLWVEAA